VTVVVGGPTTRWTGAAGAWSIIIDPARLNEFAPPGQLRRWAAQDPLMIRDYFNSLAEGLAVNSKSASFGQHRPDTGANREDLVINLLNNHLPDRLKAIAGGKVVNIEGDLSKQIDVIVKNDLFPRFDQHGKSCVIAEAVAGVISVRSHLDKAGLEETIENVASVPEFSDSTLSLTNSSIVRSNLQSQFTSNWPFRAVFAYDSIDPDIIYQHALA
jgi:hypothetical protein